LNLARTHGTQLRRVNLSSEILRSKMWMAGTSPAMTALFLMG
jgi:hypothetical protein